MREKVRDTVWLARRSLHRLARACSSSLSLLTLSSALPPRWDYSTVYQVRTRAPHSSCLRSRRQLEEGEPGWTGGRSSDPAGGSQGAVGRVQARGGALESPELSLQQPPPDLAEFDSSRTSSSLPPLCAGLSALTDRASGAISSMPSPFSGSGIEGKNGGEVLSGEDGSPPRGGARRVDGAGKWWDDEVRYRSLILSAVFKLTVSSRRRTATRPSASPCASSRRSSCVPFPHPSRRCSCRADLVHTAHSLS